VDAITRKTIILILTITILDIIHPRLLLKNKVLETGFCLRFHVEPTQLGPIGFISVVGGVQRQKLALSIESN
jgi:hypothetical protein